jgi:hypothetical protein
LPGSTRRYFPPMLSLQKPRSYRPGVGPFNSKPSNAPATKVPCLSPGVRHFYPSNALASDDPQFWPGARRSRIPNFAHQRICFGAISAASSTSLPMLAHLEVPTSFKPLGQAFQILFQCFRIECPDSFLPLGQALSLQ